MILSVPWQIKSSYYYFVILFHCAYPVLLLYVLVATLTLYSWEREQTQAHPRSLLVFKCVRCAVGHLLFQVFVCSSLAWQNLSKRDLPLDFWFTPSCEDFFEVFLEKNCKYRTNCRLKISEDLLSFNPSSLTIRSLYLSVCICRGQSSCYLS